jgi:hypothetical protein
MQTVFWFENLNAIDHFEDLSLDWGKISEWFFGKQGGKLWTGFIWLRIGSCGRLL